MKLAKNISHRALKVILLFIQTNRIKCMPPETFIFITRPLIIYIGQTNFGNLDETNLPEKDLGHFNTIKCIFFFDVA